MLVTLLIGCGPSAGTRALTGVGAGALGAGMLFSAYAVASPDFCSVEDTNGCAAQDQAIGVGLLVALTGAVLLAAGSARR